MRLAGRMKERQSNRTCTSGVSAAAQAKLNEYQRRFQSKPGSWGAEIRDCIRLAKRFRELLQLPVSIFGVVVWPLSVPVSVPGHWSVFGRGGGHGFPHSVLPRSSINGFGPTGCVGFT